MKISIVGSGNVAHHLGMALKNAGNDLLQILSRNSETGMELAHLLSTDFAHEFSDLNTDAELILFCVKDDAIAEVASVFPKTTAVVAHTSGFRSMELLEQLSEKTGVFYPLQTMRKNVLLNFENVPMLVEGSNEQVTKMLLDLAGQLSPSVHVVNELQRQYIHVAAVIANNFTNHMWELSAHLLSGQNLSLDILRPLIARSAENVVQHSPSELRTGPAARKDFFTLDAHIALLQNEPEILKVYEVITESILRSARN